MIQRFAQFSCCLWLDASVAHQSARSASSLSTSGHRVQLVRERGHHDRWHRVGPSHSQGTILVWSRPSAPWLVEEGRMDDGTRVGTGSEKTRASSRPKYPSMHQNRRLSTVENVASIQYRNHIETVSEQGAARRPAETGRHDLRPRGHCRGTDIATEHHELSLPHLVSSVPAR